MEVQTKVGNIVGYAGGGAQGIGDFGGSKIQNAWHRNGPKAVVGRYTHNQTPENISGWTPDVRARIEGSTVPLVGTDTHNIILKGSLDAKVPLIREYGETSLTLAASLEAKMDRFTAEVGVRSVLYRDLPLSDTIRAAQNNPRNAIVVGVSADVWKTADTTTTVFAEFERAIATNSPSNTKNRGSFGVNVSF